MYAFKVVTSTIIILWFLVLSYVGLKTDKKGKAVAVIMAVIETLSLIAIWG